MDQASSAFAGASFHCYEGTVDQQQDFINRYPNKEVYFTECSGIYNTDWWEDLKVRFFYPFLTLRSKPPSHSGTWTVCKPSLARPTVNGSVLTGRLFSLVSSAHHHAPHVRSCCGTSLWIPMAFRNSLEPRVVPIPTTPAEASLTSMAQTGSSTKNVSRCAFYPDQTFTRRIFPLEQTTLSLIRARR